MNVNVTTVYWIATHLFPQRWNVRRDISPWSNVSYGELSFLVVDDWVYGCLRFIAFSTFVSPSPFGVLPFTLDRELWFRPPCDPLQSSTSFKFWIREDFPRRRRGEFSPYRYTLTVELQRLEVKRFLWLFRVNKFYFEIWKIYYLWVSFTTFGNTPDYDVTIIWSGLFYLDEQSILDRWGWP